MGKSAPDAPKMPDLGEAFTQGVYADIDTLQLRKAIESASGAGTVYQYQTPNQKKDYEAAVAANKADPTKNPLPDAKDPKYNTTADFTGLGDADKAKIMVKMAGETAGISAQNQLDLQKKFGTQFQDLALEHLKRQDPEGFEGRKDLAAGVRRDYNSTDFPTESEDSRALRERGIAQSLVGGPARAAESDLARLVKDAAKSQAGAGPDYFTESAGTKEAQNAVLQRSLGDLSRGPTSPTGSPLDALMRQAGMSQTGYGQENFSGSAANQLVRNAVLQRGLDDFNLGSQLSGEQARQVEQSVRGAAAARGQALSAGGALEEIIGKYNVGEQLRQQRLSNLMNISGQSYSQEQDILGRREEQAQRLFQNLSGAQQAAYGQERADLASYQQQQQLGLSNLMNIGAQRFGQEQQQGGNQAQQAQQRLQNMFGAGAQEFTQGEAALSNDRQQAQLLLSNMLNAASIKSGEERALRQETTQQKQLRAANLSQYVMGAPLSSGFQSLQGAQQGPAPYNPLMAQGIQQNANSGQMGANFANQAFNTQAQIYATQMANQSDPFATIVGGGLGAFTGGFGGALGKKLGG